MRLHRFFIAQRIDPSCRVVVADPKLLHQWLNVLRLGPGSEVVLFDGFGKEYRCLIARCTRREAHCLVRESLEALCTPPRQLFLFASLVKKPRFEWLLEKATELGVSYIRPVIADRSEAKQANLERAKKIVREAAEQSGRGNLPALYEPMTLFDVFKEYRYFKSVAFDPHGEPFACAPWKREERLGVFIGPEGGWSTRELQVFRDQQISLCSLGAPTLRSETAAAAAAALLLLSS